MVGRPFTMLLSRRCIASQVLTVRKPLASVLGSTWPPDLLYFVKRFGGLPDYARNYLPTFAKWRLVRMVSIESIGSTYSDKLWSAQSRTASSESWASSSNTLATRGSARNCPRLAATAARTVALGSVAARNSMGTEAVLA